jgi:hypothetical protein
VDVDVDDDKVVEMDVVDVVEVVEVADEGGEDDEDDEEDEDEAGASDTAPRSWRITHGQGGPRR